MPGLPERFDPRPAARGTGPVGAVAERASGLYGITLLLVLVSFCISDLLLQSLGYSYLGAGGALYQKIHPSTYLIIVAFLVLMVREGTPTAAVAMEIERWPGAVLFLAVIMILQAVIMLKGYPLTYALDTFIAPVLLLAILGRLTARERTRLLGWLLVIFALNSAVGLGEYTVGERMLQLEVGDDVAGKIAEGLDWRPTAIFGHPLRNAVLTGLSVLALVVTPVPLAWRGLAVAAQVGAMIIFGGRSSMVIVLALAGLMGALGFVRLLLGRRFGIGTIPRILSVAVATGLLLTVLADAGAFDKVIERFEWDDSAETRVAALRMFELFDPSDIAFGISQERKEALQVLYDTQYGIEIFWLAFLMDYGLIFLLLFAVATAFLMRDIVRAVGPSCGWLIAFFFIAINTSLGLAAKTVMLGQFFVVLMLFFGAGRELFRRAEDAR